MVREHEDIVLTATLATPSVAAVTWLKDGVEIRRSKRHEMASLGDTHTLTLRGAQTMDSAVYSCRVGAEAQDFPVQVEGQRGRGQSSGNPVSVASQSGARLGLRARDRAAQSSLRLARLTSLPSRRGGHQVLPAPGARARGSGRHGDAGLRAEPGAGRGGVAVREHGAPGRQALPDGGHGVPALAHGVGPAG